MYQGQASFWSLCGVKSRASSNIEYHYKIDNGGSKEA